MQQCGYMHQLYQTAFVIGTNMNKQTNYCKELQ